MFKYGCIKINVLDAKCGQLYKILLDQTKKIVLFFFILILNKSQYIRPLVDFQCCIIWSSTQMFRVRLHCSNMDTAFQFTAFAVKWIGKCKKKKNKKNVESVSNPVSAIRSFVERILEKLRVVGTFVSRGNTRRDLFCFVLAENSKIIHTQLVKYKHLLSNRKFTNLPSLI